MGVVLREVVVDVTEDILSSFLPFVVSSDADSLVAILLRFNDRNDAGPLLCLTRLFSSSLVKPLGVLSKTDLILPSIVG